MSTLRADTIADRTGAQSTSMLNAINGSAKAWVNFNGTGTVAIRGSYNVASISDNAVGLYTVNLTNALTDTNYSISGVASDNATTGNLVLAARWRTTPPTTTSFSVAVAIADLGSLADADYVLVQAFR